MIFVFGSNLDGWHGKGAALTAKQSFGARQGVAEGPTGLSYALPTVGHNLSRMPLADIEKHVKRFLDYARTCPELPFKVTRVGCALAGYTDNDISPFFLHAPTNCWFDTKWKPILGDSHLYWGTF